MVTSSAGLAKVVLLFAACGAGQPQTVPLDNIHANFDQDGVRRLKDEEQPKFSPNKIPPRTVVLVAGKDAAAAAKASEQALVAAKPTADAPPVKMRDKGPVWGAACLGINGSSTPPSCWKLVAVEVIGKTIRISYAGGDSEGGPAIWDPSPEIIWAPLGPLPAGDYTLEMYDKSQNKTTVSRRCKVTAE